MQAAPTAGAAYFFYSLQICDQGFLGETNIFFVVIIASDSAKSESEVGMKKVSLNLRLFGDGDAVDGGAQSAAMSSEQTEDCAAEQSEKKMGRGDDKKRIARKAHRSAAPVGGDKTASSPRTGEESDAKEDAAKDGVQPFSSKGEDGVEMPASVLPRGAMRIIQGLAAMYQMQEMDFDGIADALRRTEIKNALEERLHRRNAAKQYQILLGEAEAMSKKVRGFDLKAELSDRRFRGMLRAGFSVEEAWRAVHLEQLLGAATRKAAEKGAREAAERIRRAAGRPDENGVKGQSGISRKTSVEHLTGRGIRDILRRVENGAKVKF